jgi:proteasome lid subunit RPN8/RPN11
MSWKYKALLHAQREDPRESCGLLLNVKGKERYYPCHNLSITDNQCFIIDPEDYVKADNIGEIIGVVHSHPITPPEPSEADKISCEQSKLPWYIVNPNTEQWGYCEPCGYRAPILGREWVWGVTDCWSLVRDWYRDEKQIILRDWTRPTTPEEFLRDPMFERCAWRTGFRELRSDEKLENGDLLFMSILGNGLNHVAIFLNGDVLHHLADRLSCREPYSEWLLKCTGKRYRYAQKS